MSAGVGGRLTMDHPDGADAVPADRARTEIGHAGLRPGREGRADVAALRHVFRPDSVAVVGASRRTGTVGRAILHNVVSGGYQGNIYAVNPHAFRMEGLRCLPSVTALPESVDLAVIAVPPAAVPVVADQCGRRGVGALAVVAADLDVLQLADLVAACRRYGMRLVGPNCFGIAVPGIGLDATVAARHPAPGVVGLAVQSGGLGLALADRLSRLGIGVSSFASLGDTYDVSGNDVLTWWGQDDTTTLAILDTESFGNPRTFVRTARCVGAVMPILAVPAGRPVARQEADAHAASRLPPVTREALFEQAGVVATESLGDFLATAALLASQPIPAGRRVAVISNVGAAAALAAGACAGHGLLVPKLSAQTRRRLHAFVPRGAAITGPVDTTAAVAEPSFRRCLELVAADEGVDAALVLVLPTAARGDLVTAVCAADVSIPLAAVILDQAETVRLLPEAAGRGPRPDAGLPGSIPAYSDPQTAALALARAAAYGAWRSRPPRHLSGLSGVREGDARELGRAFLAGSPRGGWLQAAQVSGLLGCYGIPLAPCAQADRSGDARDHGGSRFVIGVAQEPTFSPLVTFGPAGIAPDGPGDHAARLVPLTDTDADDLIRSASLLPGHCGPPLADRPALREILLRVSLLADDLPEVVELALTAVIARAEGASAVSARIRLAPVQPPTSFRETCFAETSSGHPPVRDCGHSELPPARAVGPHRGRH
jgi:acyl-CoA synthetase (NDP forming)